MTTPNKFRQLLQNEDLNFLLTNRIPRQALTRFMGWFSKIESPLLARLSIACWRLFTDLDLTDSVHTRFNSLQACFTRELKPGARSIDQRANLLTSPCDAIVGSCGRVQGNQIFQAKGFPYRLEDLIPDAEAAAQFVDGSYATLRLTSSMYHRFHAPYAMRLEQVTYISGDTWNVNPIALKRVEKLFCRNERAVIRGRLIDSGHPLLLVPVAAVLVASMRLRFIDVLLHLRYRGPNLIPCDVPVVKGQELGWFEHGSTIIVFAPPGFELFPGIGDGTPLRMGQALMCLPAQS